MPFLHPFLNSKVDIIYTECLVPKARAQQHFYEQTAQLKAASSLIVPS